VDVLAEWGDITQVTAADLAARHSSLAVFAGSVLGLWVVAAIAVAVGARVLDRIPMGWVRRITAVVMLVMGLCTAASAVAR
jgi:Ca2+/H+ antiporter, TMEM165/GDT1 family